MLAEFFVTGLDGSIYHVFREESEVVMKRVDRVGNAQYPDDRHWPIGEKAKGGSHIGITKICGVVMYSPSYKDGKPLDAWATNISKWGSQTGPIIGLFPTEQLAQEAFRHNSVPWDWKSQAVTASVLELLAAGNTLNVILDEPVREMLEAITKNPDGS